MQYGFVHVHVSVVVDEHVWGFMAHFKENENCLCLLLAVMTLCVLKNQTVKM